MFTFHKPRVYRSAEGCCICRAKSSSSRFTDSKKYELDSIKCFDLKQTRYGEICNACVLLVKRYKRLPVGSQRHWGHVVDARASPGTKSLSKQKRQREETAELHGSNGNNSHGTSGNSVSGEKFSKIFKKNKKVKSNASTSPSSTNAKRKTASQVWDHSNIPPNQQSLPSTPDSLDSDYEDNYPAGRTGPVVEFQTQTRASAYRSLNRKSPHAAGCLNGTTMHRSHVVGSLRRKIVQPRKLLRAIIENNVQFFDENEWQKRQSCCGPVYECEALGKSLIIDLDLYKPCVEHQKITIKQEFQDTPVHNPQTLTSLNPQQQQQPLQNLSPSTITKPSQVLKKHHLFFKRQSECFPHTDLSAINNPTNNHIITTASTTAAPATKTDLTIAIINKTGTWTSSPSAARKTSSTSIGSMKTLPDSASTTNLSTQTSTVTTTSKILSTPATTSTVNNSKSTSFMHKIKSTTTDPGKVSKHCQEKISAAVRLIPGDLNDIRPIIKTVDRGYLPYKHQQTVVAPPPAIHHQHHISIVGPSLQGAINNAKLSPTSSLAPKFSDNSSDSGFDENLQDRKSASPLQEDTEIKMLTRPTIPSGKKIFATNGVNSYCPAQSMVQQPAIENAIKLRQEYRTVPLTSSQHRNTRSSSVKVAQIVNGMQSSIQNHSAVKIAQIVNGSHNSIPQSSNNKIGASQKLHMCAIYNNNAIKHENGVTTIVPASSLAASSQTAAMSALVAPNTVTITPSPTTNATSIHNHASGLKVGLGSMTGGGTAAATTTINNSLPNLNQKIIFVKTAKYNGTNNNTNNTVTSTQQQQLSAVTVANNKVCV